ncbi:hypothetical protein [Helicobacter brantae]|uniref:Uncharacterized protein n=1 Tax=Helicobacter brantae TaxID=375927 RepID=A0A3D8J2L3_9HELI|nr:hypothetical protein [Helicobacter brantae]RDU71782.1 hypothetical protein CQA58_01705 [Helicobacter brantae]
MKERFLQSSKAFLLLEALFCLMLLSFALLLLSAFLSYPKTFFPIQPLTFTPQDSKEIVLRSGDLVFEGKERVWESEGKKIFVLEDLR